MKIALDAMGGDFAPKNPVAGALAALRDYPDISIVFVGDEVRVRAELAAHDTSGLADRISFHHASQIVDMTDSGSGYRFLSSSGIVFSYGTAAARGYPTDVPGGRQFSGMDEDATTAGYWLLRTDGQVYAYNAPDLGSR